MANEVVDYDGYPINRGDVVFIKTRGVEPYVVDSVYPSVVVMTNNNRFSPDYVMRRPYNLKDLHYDLDNFRPKSDFISEQLDEYEAEMRKLAQIVEGMIGD